MTQILLKSRLVMCAAIVCLLGGCGSELAMSTADYQADTSSPAVDFSVDETSDDVGPGDAPFQADSDVPSNSDAALETARQLIYVADVRLVVEDFSKLEGENGITQLIEKYGGHAADVSIEQNTGRARSGQWTARIPIKNYRTFLKEIKDLGFPEHFSETTEDVTAQYIDLDARIRTKKQLEERILQLLDRDVGKISDLIEVERELGRVRGEIERMESMFRTLKSRIKMTTVTINAREERNYIPPQTPSLGNRTEKAWSNSILAIKEGSKNLLVFLVALAPWLIVLIAMGLLLLLFFFVLFMLVRRWRRRGAK